MSATKAKCAECDGVGYTEFMVRGSSAVHRAYCPCTPAPVTVEPDYMQSMTADMPTRIDVPSGTRCNVSVVKEFDGTKYLYTPQEEAAGKRYIVPGNREGRRDFARAIANKTQLPCLVE